AVPARIGGIQNAQGPNIYQTATVTRQIYEIRAIVESGNSGGPLLASDGTVYGVVFAAAVGVDDTGFALTAAQVRADAQAGEHSTTAPSTMNCAQPAAQRHARPPPASPPMTAPSPAAQAPASRPGDRSAGGIPSRPSRSIRAA